MKGSAIARQMLLLTLLLLAVSTGQTQSIDAADDRGGLIWSGSLKVDALQTSGSRDGGTSALGHLEVRLAIDLDSLAGWEGSNALLSVISDSGRGPQAKYVGNHMGLTNIEVPFPTTTRLFNAWLQKTWLDGRLAILAGLYPIDSEFFTMDYAGVFLGPQYGTPADLALTRGPSIFNNSAFGIRLKAHSEDRTLYTMGAVLDGIPNDPAHPKRTAIRFDKGDGSFAIGEIGWLPHGRDDLPHRHAKAALGLWGYSAKVPDLLDLDASLNPLQRRSRGGYLLGETVLLPLNEDGSRFVAGFARHTWTDGNSTPIRGSTNLGINVQGILPTRPDDVLGIAYTGAALSRKWRAAQDLAGTATASAENAWEVTYRYVLSPTFALQPEFQHVRNPGGLRSVSAARLIGVRLDLSY